MAEGKRPLHPETITVGLGYDPAAGGGAAKPPLYLTSTFVYESAQHAKEVHRVFFDGARPGETPPEGYIYARLGNPNMEMVERKLAALDQAEEAAGFASGMAAANAVMMQHLRPGDSVVHGMPFYGGVDALLNKVLSPFGVRTFPFGDGLDRDAMQAAADAAMAAGPLRMIWVETPANPTGAVVDIGLAAEIAAQAAARQGFKPLVVVDNTFLGPLLQSPLACGADLSVISLTKYCGGHSDLLAGGVSGSSELIRPIKFIRTYLGAHMDPHTAWLLFRSFESLHLRTERACENALAIARFLEKHPKVERVTFTGLAQPGSREHALMQRQSRGAGSTFSFRVVGGEAEAFRFLDALTLPRLAVSLGGTETLICHPASTTHYAIARDKLEAAGVSENALRLSVGLEHVDDLIADFDQALAQI
jgi:methionine-gamma-lyase